MLWLAFWLVACTPDWDEDPASDCNNPAAETLLDVSSLPPAPLEAAPPILHLRISASEPIDLERLYLVEGDIGPSHLSQLANADPSMALTDRLVPAVHWLDGEHAVLAPQRELELGARYTVASGAPKGMAVIDIDQQPWPSLQLVWPPEGQSAGGLHATWCGSEPLGDVAPPLAAGALPDGRGKHCARIDHGLEHADQSLATPAFIANSSGATIALLEPAVLYGGAELEAITPLPCPADQVSIGPGCAAVQDDRLTLDMPQTPLLWVLSDSQQLDVVTPSVEHAITIGPLPPASHLWLQIGVVDRAAQVVLGATAVTTTTPTHHVVINEVLANSIGPEPEQEWVELYNDGLVEAPLEGWVLEDIGGGTTLPKATLAPGGFALVVNHSFDEQGEYDPTPAPGTLVIRVDKLGKNGLSNQGEPLKLKGPGGTVVSRFPQLPKPKSGRSVMRMHPTAPDDDAGSFILSEEGAATPGH